MKNLHSLMKRYGEGLLVCVAAAVGAAVMLGSTCSVFNKAPTVPVISGPSAGVVGVPVTFKATATDPESDSIAIQFDWGDSSTLAWSNFVASGETTSVQHAYSDSGAFSVKAKAKDRKGKESSLSAGFALDMLAAGGGYPDSVYAEIPTADGGCAGAITPDGRYLYVASGGGTMKVTPVRLADRTALPPISLEADPYRIESSTDGTHMFVTLPGADKVVAIRTSDNTIDLEATVVHRPEDLAVTPDGQLLLVTVAQPDPGYLLFLRTQDLGVVDTTRSGMYLGHITVDRAGEYAYGTVNGGVMVFTLASHSVADTIAGISNPGSLGLSRDGHHLNVGSWYDTGFVVIHLPDRTVEARLNVGEKDIRDFVFTAEDAYLMFSYLRGVEYVDTRTYSVVDSLVLSGEGRRAMVMHPKADTLYVIGYRKVYLIGPR
jgi:DNA-binding beta-propeller fold protein YncE